MLENHETQRVILEQVTASESDIDARLAALPCGAEDEADRLAREHYALWSTLMETPCDDPKRIALKLDWIKKSFTDGGQKDRGMDLLKEDLTRMGAVP